MNPLDRLLPEFAGTDRTLVMGILNVTPDSFSDGGAWADLDAAVRRGRQMLDEGADLIDVGGESSRPGAQRVSLAAELDRVLPVVAALADQAVISVDTTRGEVARRALEAGARIINDVSGSCGDPEMTDVIAAFDAPYICMYSTGPAALGSTSEHSNIEQGGDPLAEVVNGLRQRLTHLQNAGVPLERVIIDPGLGFAYPGQANWEILGGLDRIKAIGRPVLVGASRKRFLASAMPVDDASNEARDTATAAISALSAAAGVWAVRVHEIRGNLAAVLVGSQWRAGATQ